MKVPVRLKAVLRKIDRLRGQPEVNETYNDIAYENGVGEIERIVWCLFEIARMVPGNAFMYHGVAPTIRYSCSDTDKDILSINSLERVYIVARSNFVEIETQPIDERAETKTICGLVGTEEVLRRLEEILKLTRRSCESSNSG